MCKKSSLKLAVLSHLANYLEQDVLEVWMFCSRISNNFKNARSLRLILNNHESSFDHESSSEK